MTDSAVTPGRPAGRQSERNMQILFLGTSAAEQTPSIFCRCAFCGFVREHGGRDLRTRASLRIGESYQIDFGPDINWQMHRNGIDLYSLEHLLITHTHNDHFQFEEVASKSLAAEKNGKPLHVYMSIPALRYVESVFHTFDAQIEEEKTREAFLSVYPLHGLEYFQRYTVGNLQVHTIMGSHLAEGNAQYSLNYLVDLPDGRCILYAVDTGYYREETWEFLSGRRVDILVMDCTFPRRRGGVNPPGSHHTFESFIATLSRMRGMGFIDDGTRVFATHFDPHRSYPHEELDRRFQETGYTLRAAYDGLALA